MNNELNRDEQEIEDNFEQQKSILQDIDQNLLQKTAEAHLKLKKSITIRMSIRDLEAMKLKASKLGLAYQTYINMIIHQEANKL